MQPTEDYSVLLSFAHVLSHLRRIQLPGVNARCIATVAAAATPGYSR